MKYKMLIKESTNNLSYSKPNYTEMLEDATECEKFDFTHPQGFRVVINDKEYKLSKQYVFLVDKITLYILES